MLYKHAQTTLETVVDYTRKLKSVPNLLVPVYPEKDDMLLIQGEKQGDIWFGKVLNVDLSNKAVDVYFCVEKQQHPNRFVRESLSRQARNTVIFDSIIGTANGHWISGNTWQKSI
jgi:exosome complex RNA-binding protein Csl4